MNLVDRFSLAIWITRRVIPMAVLRASSLTGDLPTPSPTIPADLPGLLVCLEQRHCVLRLSDARVAAVRRCLAAVTSAKAEVKADLAQQRTQLTNKPMIRRSRSSLRAGTVYSKSTSEKPIQTSTKLRRTIVITFSMQELILQLDGRGRPLAECRLTSTAARFSRFTDAAHSMTTYEVYLHLHSLTIADALCGLGGDFDLLAASHRDVR